MKKGLLFIVFLSIFIALAMTFVNPSDLIRKTEKPSEVIQDVRLQLDPASALVPIEKLENGCEEKDCIRSIDKPQFESIEEAGDWLSDSDKVFVLSQNGDSKIYPEKIITWHEVINDEIASEPVVITFSPLSGTAIAFERRVDGIVTTFGVSGKLFNSNLILYDRYEGSLWQQFSGQAVTGPAAKRGEILKKQKLTPLSWMKARESFPEAMVLSRNTGFAIDYEKLPYDSYQSSAEVYFEDESLDKRLHPKAQVYGIVVDNIAKAYPEQSLFLVEKKLDRIGEKEIEIINENGILTFRLADSGEEITALKSFWFVWAEFYPNSML